MIDAVEFYDKNNKFKDNSVISLFKDDIIHLMEEYAKLNLKEVKNEPNEK